MLNVLLHARHAWSHYLLPKDDKWLDCLGDACIHLCYLISVCLTTAPDHLAF